MGGDGGLCWWVVEFVGGGRSLDGARRLYPTGFDFAHAQADPPTFGYVGLHRGGGHMMSGVNLSDYLIVRPSGTYFMYTGAVQLPDGGQATRSEYTRDAHGGTSCSRLRTYSSCIHLAGMSHPVIR